MPAGFTSQFAGTEVMRIANLNNMEARVNVNENDIVNVKVGDQASIHVDAYPDKVFVAWPRTCGSTGDPLGAVSLQLNPDWVSRLHEVDYEVLGPGKHQVSPYCALTTRVFALSSASFPRASRTATADDTALGTRPGDTY